MHVAIALIGVGGALVVGHDGEPGWQVLRVAAVAATAAAVWWAVARSPSVRVPALLALGLVAVPVGVGIAVPFLTKTGVTARSLAGLAVLLGGLLVFAAGVRDLLHLGRRRATFPAVGATIVVLAVLVWSLGQAVAVTNVPRTSVGDRTPADAGLAHRDVSFPATDGVELSGWYVPSRNGAAVVVLHGAGSTRSAVLDHATVLAEAGYGVLLADSRGHGRSAGRAMDFGWYGDHDLGGAVAFLQQQPDVDPRRIGAVGMSMGGEIAVGAVAVAGLHAVVAEGATTRTAADRAWLSEEYGWRGALTEHVGAITDAFTDLLTAAHPPIGLREAVRTAPERPVLLIAGGAVEEEPLAARHIRGGSTSTVDVWVADGAGHTDALATHPDEWAARVLGFLDDALLEPRSQGPGEITSSRAGPAPASAP